MHHYSDVELECYRNGKMNFLFRNLCRFHLRNCFSCRTRWERIKKDELLIAELKAVIDRDQNSENDDTYMKLYEHFGHKNS